MNFFIVLFNRIINILKYPIAMLFALLTYELLMMLVEVIEIIYNYKTFYKPLFIGMGVYFVLWFILFNNRQGNWFLTIEHEFTHTLFALLTFHKIVDFKATDNMGGHMQYSGVGGGNWLITIAPYFFPTFSMFIVGLIYFSKSQYYPVLTMLLGYSIVYHIHSTYKETSSQQPDIQEVGVPFALLFLPSANIFSLITLLSFIPNDRIYFWRLSEHLSDYISVHFIDLIEYFEKLIMLRATL